MLIHAHIPKRKKKKASFKSLKAKTEHEAFLLTHGYYKGIKFARPNYRQDLTVESKAPEMSNQIPENGIKKSIDDYKWKKDIQETPETIASIEDKKNRIAPLWNKGANQYITDKTEIETLGRKV